MEANTFTSNANSNFIKMDTMENKEKLIELLVQKTIDLSKTTLELIRLKTLDKTSDVVSSMIPHSFVLIMLASFAIFLNFGIAFWLGEILNSSYLGFFVIAGFYIFIGIAFHVFIHKWIKKTIYNYMIKQLLK